MNAFISNAGEFNDFCEAYLRYQCLELTGSLFLHSSLCWVFVAAYRLSLAAVCGFLISVASLVAHGLKCALTCRFSCSAACGIFLEQGSNPYLQHWQVDA